MSQRLLDLIEQHLDPVPWHGLRVVAADASDVRLTSRDTTKRLIKTAKVFALYLPGIEMMHRATLYDNSTGERQMLFEHLDDLRTDDLLVLDRGYPAAWLMSALEQRGLKFCMRIDDTARTQVKAFVRSGAAQAIITLNAPNGQQAQDYQINAKPMQVRLIRQISPNGLIRVLATNLLDTQTWPASEFAALYHQRWRVEEAFKRIKHRLDLEAVTGLSWLTHQQDLGAKVLCDNLNALLCWQASVQCDQSTLPSQSPTVIRSSNGVLLKINRTRAFAHVRQCLPRWLYRAEILAQELTRLLDQIAQNVIRFTPGRNRPRPLGTKPHKAFAAKAVM